MNSKLPSIHLDHGRRLGHHSGNAKFLVIGGVALLALILGLAGMWLSGQPASADLAEEEASRFLEQLREGQIEQAWEETSAEFKSFIGLDRLQRTVKANAVLRGPCELVACQPTEVGPLNLMECLFESARFDGVTVRVLLAPTRERQWKVERLEVQ